jgi:hypothetical protein
MSHFEKTNSEMNFNLKFSYEKFDFIIIGSKQEYLWHLVHLKGKGSNLIKFVGGT